MSGFPAPEVQARFYVAKIEHNAYGPKGAGAVTLAAVSRGDQNRQWASATPSGTITMQINNQPAAQWFADHLGDDVAVGFTLAVVHTPEDGHPYRESLADPGTYYGPPNCGDCNRPEGEHRA